MSPFKNVANLSVSGLLSESKKAVDNITHLAMDRRIRLAVTGLSQSGKTAFITSLIHQLLHGLSAGNLPFFSVVAENRFLGSKTMLQPNMEIPAFQYDKFISSLTGEKPEFPRATDGLSEIRLAIRFQPGSFISRQLSKTATLYLDIVDYPGEWLLDLPLLNMTFKEWSEQLLNFCSEEPRTALAAEWLKYLQNIDSSRVADEETMRQASQLFTKFLHDCRTKKTGLSYLQPGRFLIPGDLKDAPILTFCPLASSSNSPPKGSVYEVMEQRFESYKERVVKKFYRDHFSKFDRQIVLVDLQKALNHGPGSFGDMQSALQGILNSFTYGNSNLLTRLFQPKIDKLLFVATKADHVAANQHPNLERLLNRMVVRPVNDAVFQGVEVKTLAISSVVCTQTVVREHHGRRLSFVKGVPKGQSEEVLLFPGEIPETVPSLTDWEENRFNFLDFQPQLATSGSGGSVPHLRMDQAIEFLLGDKLS
ncbi:MAG: YcjX family protein [Magnetococcales bacterium]|nr:YcjX family protein [Magnetococcales bacterium]